MNAQTQPAVDLLHVARSRFLNAFSLVERAVQSRLAAFGKEINGPLTQRIDALRAIRPSPSYSKKQRDELHSLLAQLVKLNDVRCDVAHGSMHAVRIESELYACFINPQGDHELGLSARLTDQAGLERFAEELRQIAEGLASS